MVEEKRKTYSFDSEEILPGEDLSPPSPTFKYPPDTELLDDMDELYEDNGTCNSMVNLVLNFLSTEKTVTIPENQEANDYLNYWIEGDYTVQRPHFDELFRMFCHQGLLKGYGVGEKQSVDGEYLDNIFIRPSQKWWVERDEISGLLYPRPYWYYDMLGAQYKGPVPLGNVVWGTVNRRHSADYYGVSPFMPLRDDLTQRKDIMDTVQDVFENYAEPIRGVELPAGSTQDDALQVYESLEEHADDPKAKKFMVVHNGAKFNFYIPNISWRGVVEFIDHLENKSYIESGIPITLLKPESNYAVSNVHVAVFDWWVDRYRNQMANLWINHCFRHVLMLAGFEDYWKLKIAMTFAEFPLEKAARELLSQPTSEEGLFGNPEAYKQTVLQKMADALQPPEAEEGAAFAPLEAKTST